MSFESERINLKLKTYNSQLIIKFEKFEGIVRLMSKRRKGGIMKIRDRILAITVLIFTLASTVIVGVDGSSKRFLLDEKGGAIEVRTAHPDDQPTRDAVRRGLRNEIRNGV